MTTAQPLDQRQCKWCEKTLKRKDWMKGREWRGLKFCSVDCSVMHSSTNRGPYSQPLSANAAAVRKWKDRNPDKRRAHRVVQRALKNSLISRKPCHVCGTKRAQAHHEDYSFPLDIEWLCAKHHKARHKRKAH